MAQLNDVFRGMQMWAQMFRGSCDYVDGYICTKRYHLLSYLSHIVASSESPATWQVQSMKFSLDGTLEWVTARNTCQSFKWFSLYYPFPSIYRSCLPAERHAWAVAGLQGTAGCNTGEVRWTGCVHGIMMVKWTKEYVHLIKNPLKGYT